MNSLEILKNDTTTAAKKLELLMAKANATPESLLAACKGV